LGSWTFPATGLHVLLRLVLLWLALLQQELQGCGWR
jgi:hypothetical protein